MSIDLSGILHGGYTEKEIRKAFSKIASTDLVNHLEAFILSQDTVSRSVKMLSRKLALSVSNDCLTFEHLKMFIKYQESEDEDVRFLASDLAGKISEEILLENLAYLIDCQEADDADIRLLVGDLVLSVDLDKLSKHLALIKSKNEESKNRYTIELTAKLLENLDGEIREDKISELIELILA